MATRMAGGLITRTKLCYTVKINNIHSNHNSKHICTFSSVAEVERSFGSFLRQFATKSLNNAVLKYHKTHTVKIEWVIPHNIHTSVLYPSVWVNLVVQYDKVHSLHSCGTVAVCVPPVLYMWSPVTKYQLYYHTVPHPWPESPLEPSCYRGSNTTQPSTKQELIITWTYQNGVPTKEFAGERTDADPKSATITPILLLYINTSYSLTKLYDPSVC